MIDCLKSPRFSLQRVWLDIIQVCCTKILCIWRKLSNIEHTWQFDRVTDIIAHGLLHPSTKLKARGDISRFSHVKRQNSPNSKISTSGKNCITLAGKCLEMLLIMTCKAIFRLPWIN